MTSRTCVRRVVFTHAYPALERFAAYHFLATHPLRHHPMWLDEDDLRNIAAHAQSRGVANPLRLDVHAHHPLVSPYAQKLQRGGRRRRGEQCARDREQHNDNDSGSGNDSGRDATLSGTAMATRGAAPRKYLAPICRTTICRRVYLYNIEQMYDANAATMPTTTSTATDAQHDDDGEDEHEPDDEHERDDDDDDVLHARVRSTSSPSLRADADDDWMSRRVLALRRRYADDQATTTTTATTTMQNALTRARYGGALQAQLYSYARQHGYRLTWWATSAQWTQCGARPRRGERPHCVELPVETKLVHVSLLADAEAVLQRCVVFAKSGRLLYCFGGDDAAVATAATTTRRTRPLHYALNGDSQDKRGGSDDDQGSEADGDALYDAVDGGVCADDCIDAYGLCQPHHPQASSSSSSLPRHDNSFDHVCALLLRDMREHDYAVPLYFTAQHLRQCDLALRSDAVGVPLATRRTNVLPHAIEVIDSAMMTTTATTTTTAQATRKPSDGAAWRAASSHPTTTTTTTPRYGYYYHLSHIRFPDSFVLSADVVVAELQYPGVPLHGITGRRLRHDELCVEQLINVAPQLASLIATPAAATATATTTTTAATTTATRRDTHVKPAAPLLSDDELTAHVQACASPRQCRGRSLWFSAEDVLALRGTVDVNATPVEVRTNDSDHCDDDDDGNNNGSSNNAEGVWMAYNVECLVRPDDGFRSVNSPCSALRRATGSTHATTTS